MKKYILVLDIGTTNVKAFIFDKQGKIITQAIEKTKYIIKTLGQVEQDPFEIWNLCKKVINRVIKKKRLKYNNFYSMGLTSQRGSFLLWNKVTGEKYTNIITWQDKRSAEYAEKKSNLLWLKILRCIVGFICKFIHNTKLTTISILKFDSVQASVRTGYIFEKNPALKAKVFETNTDVLWGTIDTWILWNLTGKKVHATDYSNASSTGILDPFNLKWNSIVRNIFGIPEHILPEIRETRGDFGSTSLFGGGEIHITAVIADQQASLFGQGCWSPGDIKTTNGTGSFIDLNTGYRPFVSKRRLYPLIAWRASGNTTYMLEGQSQNTGNIIDWLMKNLNLISNPDETESLAMSVDSTSGVVFLPAFTTGLTFPYWDSTVTGNVFGLHLNTKKAHIIRAVLEGICFRIRDIIDGILQDTKIRIKMIKLDGGVSKNKYILQFLSDITGIKVEHFPHSEPTALGTCFMAGLASDCWKSEEDILSLLNRGTIYIPSMDCEMREKKYRYWKNVIHRSLNFK